MAAGQGQVPGQHAPRIGHGQSCSRQPPRSDVGVEAPRLADLAQAVGQIRLPGCVLRQCRGIGALRAEGGKRAVEKRKKAVLRGQQAGALALGVGLAPGRRQAEGLGGTQLAAADGHHQGRLVVPGAQRCLGARVEEHPHGAHVPVTRRQVQRR